MNARSYLRGTRCANLAVFPFVLLGGLMMAGCPASISVPDVIGLQLSEAELTILDAGLTVGSVTTQADPTAPAGEVLLQDPPAGALAGLGWPVDLVVAGASDYDTGFDDGFAEDEWYYEGYQDSQDTLGSGPILYEGDEIPSPASPEYDRGYWDGVWTAYNDGYFDAYDAAFEKGFMDGYEAAYIPGYATFLQDDVHVEYGTGGYDDGYNDGFSEGRVFGAYDYVYFIGPDWEDALEDYRAGTDLCVVTVCTEGLGGPVELYEHGTNPALKSGAHRLERPDAPSIRRPAGDAAAVTSKRSQR